MRLSKKQLLFAYLMMIVGVKASYLYIVLDDQTLVPHKRPCKVTVELSSDSSTASETLQLTRRDELRTTQMYIYNRINIFGHILIPRAVESPDPRNTYTEPDFTATHGFDEQVYNLKIRLTNDPSNLNVTMVEFLERRFDHDPPDF